MPLAAGCGGGGNTLVSLFPPSYLLLSPSVCYFYSGNRRKESLRNVVAPQVQNRAKDEQRADIKQTGLTYMVHFFGNLASIFSYLTQGTCHINQRSSHPFNKGRLKILSIVIIHFEYIRSSWYCHHFFNHETTVDIYHGWYLSFFYHPSPLDLPLASTSPIGALVLLGWLRSQFLEALSL